MKRVERAHACPSCEHVAVHPPAVRQGIAVLHGLEIGVVDIGWECKECGTEWGFEMLGHTVTESLPKEEGS